MEIRKHSQTWIEVDLDRLVKNYETAKTLVSKETVVTCVLKSNAYGHGALKVGEALSGAGCQSFAVSSAREALALRESGITGEIIVMGISEEMYFERLSKSDITVTLTQNVSVAVPLKVHIKVDTGFHRLGFPCDEKGAQDIVALNRNENVSIVGLFSHLSLIDRDHDERQHEKLMWMQGRLKERGMDIGDMHICDSIGMVRYPAFHHKRVRVGAFLYGVRPMGSESMAFACHETLRFLAAITALHSAPKGDYVGYDDSAPLPRDTVIATLQAGYGDGYPRRMAKRAGVIIRGKLAPVLSLVCMDQMMVDVTDIAGVCVGDVATLLGGAIDYQTYAAWGDTNRNEMLAILSERPERLYFRKDVIVSGRSD